jgi:hypothetical protein
MLNRIKSIVFVVGAVVIFTAQTNAPDNKAQHAGGQHASAPHAPIAHPTQNRAPVQNRPQAPNRNAAPHQAPNRTQTQTHRQAPVQTVRRAEPVAQQTQGFGRRQDIQSSPRVYGIPVPKDARNNNNQNNNRLFHHQHNKRWQPIYNFYDNEYHFYPYINVTTPVELSADVVTISFNGETYYYDQGSFYVQDPQGYLATPPPIGIIVGVLPPNARQITTDTGTFYRYKGVCYLRVEQGYQVVDQVGSSSDGS